LLSIDSIVVTVSCNIHILVVAFRVTIVRFRTCLMIIVVRIAHIVNVLIDKIRVVVSAHHGGPLTGDHVLWSACRMPLELVRHISYLRVIKLLAALVLEGSRTRALMASATWRALTLKRSAT
jgi:hypothetical protein